MALGSVSTFFAELRQQGLVREEQNGRVLDTEGLLARWVQEYGQALRPQRYRWATPPGIRWRQLPMVTGAYWSGEPAARLLLQEKRSSPTSFTLYSPCLPDWGLIPDPVTGLVIILAPPFLLHKIASTSGLASPLLVYTDLLLSGRDVDQGLAQQIRNRYLAHLL
ncbi:type IV toxin-antitoxin system AbiEi family antitoxin [Hymenobacter bucti]|uniref:Type IV toxin-antitoxin system AbiEi family antitoxin n=1 Tax=Hymenobacter bucti TaxID=1844114 RepID=A0ABW4QXF4_9BACT